MVQKISIYEIELDIKAIKHLYTEISETYFRDGFSSVYRPYASS
jgi:hypothetical protein